MIKINLAVEEADKSRKRFKVESVRLRIWLLAWLGSARCLLFVRCLLMYSYIITRMLV